MSAFNIDEHLIKKYDQPGPRYTSYPPANFFQPHFDRETYLRLLEHSNQQKPRNISFYFHVPFCPQLCNFCGCNSELIRNKATNDRYFAALKKEFLAVSSLLDHSRPISQIHWGGGTPNGVPFHYIADIMETIKAHFSFSPDVEIAMECNPAYLSVKQMTELSEMGFNRISLGIQDFHPHVLEIIHRKTSKLPIEEIVETLHEYRIQVNLDFVYGLPAQQVDSFRQNMLQAISLNPERIVTFSYAHVPWVKSAQKALEQYHLPSASEKLALFQSAYQLLTDAGYIAIGLDHFAKSDDELTKALIEKTLHRNFMGYCTRNHAGQVYAFGASSITQLENAYIQNNKNTDEYMQIVEKHEFAPEKGYKLSDQDQICRQVIEQLMCNEFVDLDETAKALHLTYDELKSATHFSEEKLLPMIHDGLVTWKNHQLTVSTEGKMILRNVAMLFDPLLNPSSSMHYSRTV
ncbi:MAG: oxygen-independent coproporphyrinogen III oxidase [Microbacter sp.]